MQLVLGLHNNLLMDCMMWIADLHVAYSSMNVNSLNLFIVCLFSPDWNERVKQIAKLWRKLSADQKQPYLVNKCFILFLYIDHNYH